MVQTDLFLTHDWGVDEKGRDNHKRVSIVNKKLKALGYRTWFDSDRMVGDIVQQMSSGIENTKAVLVFLTERYIEKVIGNDPSDNCKLEFNHAVRRKTNARMISIVMETRIRDTSTWRGSIGMFLGGKIYIDMSGDLADKNYLENQFLLLEKELLNLHIQPNKNNVTNDTIPMEKLNICTKDDEMRAREAKSTGWEPSFTIKFKNMHNRPVRLIWKDYEGEEKPIREKFNAGGVTGEQTYGTHPFIARDCETKKLLYFTNGRKTDVFVEGLAFGAVAGETLSVNIVSKR